MVEENLTYSIHFPIEGDDDEYSIDWSWYEKGKWTVSSREYGLGHGWKNEGSLDGSRYSGRQAYQALLKCFGLESRAHEFPIDDIIIKSPAELAKIEGRNPKSDTLGDDRRASEVRVPLEKLFSVLDETESNCTWDYRVMEKAVNLFNVNDECFAMITEREETSDGATGIYQDSSYYFGYLFSKNEPKLAEPIPHSVHRTGIVELSSKRKENVVAEIEKKTGVPSIRENKSIALSIGRVYISDGNLILDRTQDQ